MFHVKHFSFLLYSKSLENLYKEKTVRKKTLISHGIKLCICFGKIVCNRTVFICINIKKFSIQ